MAKSNDGLAFGIVLLSVLLLSDPRCTTGCRTLAEHLLSHGLKRLFGGLGT